MTDAIRTDGITTDGVDANLLQARGVCLTYSRAEQPTLDGIDLTVTAGERVGILGRSGSGKSTLLRILLALQAADRGTVSVLGNPVHPGGVRRLRWLRRLVQYVPQDPGTSLTPTRSVRHLVGEPVRRLGNSLQRNDLDRLVEAALESVGVTQDLRRARAGELSGGQAQRVAIARALVLRPALLVADEPVSGLDLPLRNTVLDTLRRATDETGAALLLVAHDVAAVAAICDRVLVLHEGRIVEDGPVTDVLTGPEHPETRNLLHAVPRLHPAAPAR